MYNLIGIRGHRGSGKDSVAYLLAKTIDWFDIDEEYEVNEPFDNEAYQRAYKQWVDDLLKDKEKTISEADLRVVYLDAFGDAPKLMVQQLLGCDSKYLREEKWKDHAVVNLRTFEIEEVDELPEGLMEPSTMMSYCPSFLDDERSEGECKMSLRDFILYFGINVMQKYFGQDVWVKSVAMNDKRNVSLFGDDSYRIFTDVKAPTEVSYIKDNGGKVINVQRKGHVKNGGLDLLKNDKRWDYLIEVNGDLNSIRKDIVNIAVDIYYGKYKNQ